MPVSREELNLTLEDGINIIELISPVKYDGENLTLEIMKLEKSDTGGRPRPVPAGEMQILQYDTVINATGAGVGIAGFKENGIKLTESGLPLLNENNESSIENVYISGDCAHGTATIVKAMGSSRIIAMDILAELGLSNDFIRFPDHKNTDELYLMKGRLVDDKLPLETENRCLSCGTVCEICADLCPNRANIAVSVNSVEFTDCHQIIHIDGMCNECGNCGVFCPHDGNPYLDKLTLYWKEEDFSNSENPGFLKLTENRFRIRNTDKEVFDTDLGSDKLSGK